MGEWAGLSRVFPVRAYPGQKSAPPNDQQRVEAEELLKRLIADESEIQLLLVSGHDYLGYTRKPGVLYDALFAKRSTFKLTVLLLDPACQVAKDRAAKMRLTEDQYAEGIRATIWTLRSLKVQLGMDVTVKVYDEIPIWQMVLSPKELWLLCAHGLAANESPVYCLERDAPYGLAYGLMAVWDRRWDKAQIVDLKTVTEPDWTKVVDRVP